MTGFIVCTIREVEDVSPPLEDKDCEEVIAILEEAIGSSAYKDRIQIGGSD